MQTTAQWLSGLLEDSQWEETRILKKRLNDASGQGRALQELIARGRPEWPGGILLTGPAGSGKHNLAWHLVQALGQTNCGAVFLTGELLGEEADNQEAVRRLNALVDSFYDENQGLCLVLEEPEDCPSPRRLYTLLGRILQDYRDHQEETPPLLLVLIARSAPRMPAVLRENLLPLPCALPDLDARRACLEDRARMIRSYVSLDLLAKLTDGCSYEDLGRIADLLGFLVDASGRAPDEAAILACIRRFRPEEKKAEANPIAASLERLEEILSGLSEALTKGAVRSVAVSSPQTGQSLEREGPILQTEEINRQVIEDMPVKDLSVDLFGEERAQNLMEN